MTPVVLIFGQSNASNFYGSGALETALQDEGSDAIFLNTAKGGTSVGKVGAQWNIVTGDGVDEPGVAYLQTLDAIDTLLSENPDAYIAGAVWIQGEADVNWDTDLDYYTPARTLFEAVHEHTGSEFPIVVVGLSSYHGLDPEGIANVQEDQQKLATDMESVSFVSTDDIIEAYDLTREETMHDHLHYANEMHHLIAGEVVQDPNFRAGLKLDALEIEEENSATSEENDLLIEEATAAQDSAPPVIEDTPVDESSQPNAPDDEKILIDKAEEEEKQDTQEGSDEEATAAQDSAPPVIEDTPVDESSQPDAPDDEKILIDKAKEEEKQDTQEGSDEEATAAQDSAPPVIGDTPVDESSQPNAPDDEKILIDKAEEEKQDTQEGSDEEATAAQDSAPPVIEDTPVDESSQPNAPDDEKILIDKAEEEEKQDTQEGNDEEATAAPVTEQSEMGLENLELVVALENEFLEDSEIPSEDQDDISIKEEDYVSEPEQNENIFVDSAATDEDQAADTEDKIVNEPIPEPIKSFEEDVIKQPLSVVQDPTQSDETPASDDGDEKMAAETPAGAVLGFAALGASVGMAFFALFGAIGLVAMFLKNWKTSEEEESDPQIAEAFADGGLSLPDILPVTDVIEEGAASLTMDETTSTMDAFF